MNKYMKGQLLNSIFYYNIIDLLIKFLNTELFLYFSFIEVWINNSCDKYIFIYYRKNILHWESRIGFFFYSSKLKCQILFPIIEYLSLNCCQQHILELIIGILFDIDMN